MKITSGGIIREPGNSKEINTGWWREGLRPEWNAEKCAGCLICVNFCPEDAIKVEGGKIHHIDYTKCKGCGICANECPAKAITMAKE